MGFAGFFEGQPFKFRKFFAFVKELLDHGIDFGKESQPQFGPARLGIDEKF